MDPGTVFCPTLECPASGPPGQGPIGSHSRQAKRFSCRQGRKTFTTTTGPGCYRLRPAAETGVMVITGLAHGWPPQAIVAAFGIDERTGADWLARAGRQGPTVHALLGEPPRDLGQVQADAIRVKKQGGIRWWRWP